jgi:hypothetical protein
MSKIVASYLVKVTLREREDEGQAVRLDVPQPPTNEEVERLTKQALYDALPYFGDLQIGVTSERTDR